MLRLRPSLLLAFLWVPWIGCTPDPLPAAEAAPYDYCSFADEGEPCSSGTTVCELFLCTAPCLVASDCPPSDVGEVVCEVLRQGRRCAIQCENDDDCPDTTSCQSLDRVNGETVHLCKGG